MYVDSLFFENLSFNKSLLVYCHFERSEESITLLFNRRVHVLYLLTYFIFLFTMLQMSKVEKLLSHICEKTDNKYSYLRIKNISFSQRFNKLSISFIFPSSIELLDEDKDCIKGIIRNYVNLPLVYEITFNKSYVEKDLIQKNLLNYLDKNNHLFFTQTDLNNIKVDIKQDAVVINFALEEPMLEYFSSYKVAVGIKEYLSRCFTADFEITTTKLDRTPPKEAMLKERFESVKEKSELDMILTASKDKYIVEDMKVIVGKDIMLSPRYIASINRVYEDCAIAGTIENLTERTFERTRKKKDSTEVETITKVLFNFRIKDDTGAIYSVIFPSKKNYHKMNLLKNGDKVIVEGKVSKYNGAFEMNAKNISLCSIPSKTLYDVYVEKGSIDGYRYVRPQPFTSSRQANLFEDRHLSREVENGTFVVYDFETTGIDYTSDKIIEIGALKIVNGKFTEVFTTLVNPQMPIPPEASRVNRITNDMVSHSYAIEQVIRDFYLFCKDSTLVGYNSIAFDRLFLNKEAKKVGITFDNDEIDAFLLAKQKLSGLKNYKLGTVSSFLDVKLLDAHRALNDVIATAEVFLKLY